MPERVYHAGASVLLAAGFLIARPQVTAWRWLDVVELFVAAAVLPVLLRRATWSVVVLGLVALAVGSIWSVPAVVAATAVGVVGWRQHRPVVTGWACTALVLMVAVRPLHRSTWSVGWLVAVALLALLVDVATRRAMSRVRTASRWTLVALGVLAIGLGAFGARLMGPAKTLNSDMRAAIDSLRGGQIDAATNALDQSASGCATVHTRLGGIPGFVVRVVPGIGAQIDDGSTFAAECRREVGTVNSAVRELRTILTPVNQQIDMSRVPEVAPLIEQARDSLRRLRASTDAWMNELPIPSTPSAITRRLRTIDSIDARLAEVHDMATQLPALLGSDRPRRYFVMFLTQAESRPLVGHMGNWATVTVDNGHVALERSGRAPELNLFNYDNKRLTGLDEYRRRFEGALRGGVDTKPDPDMWSLFTVTGDLPTAGEVVRQLAPQSGIGEVDGVIAVDIGALAHLITLSGPVELPDYGITLTFESARQMLLVDQYRLFPREQRVGFLQAVAVELTNRLFDGRIDLASAAASLRTSLDEGGVGLWLVNAGEQTAAVEAGAAWSYPRPDGRDGFVVNQLNRSPNKLDAFLKRRLEYEAVVDVSTGDVTAHGSVELTNTFDPAVQPPHTEAGNIQGDPHGSLRAQTCFDTPWDVFDASEEVLQYEYLGWNEWCAEPVIEAGQSVTVSIEMEGTLDVSHGYCFVSRGQVNAIADEFHVRVTTTDGAVLVDTRLDGPRTQWLVGPGCGRAP